MMDLCRLTSSAVDVDQPDDGLKMVEIDFQALCRICGALGENLTSVFGKRAADRLRERIARYLQIEILQEDYLPTKICDGCRETLDQFHELFDKCHRTAEKFRTMMSSAEELKELEKEETAVVVEKPARQQQQKRELRNSKVETADVVMKSLEKEDESGKETKVPEEGAKKNTKENKRKEEEHEEDQDVAQETKGKITLLHVTPVEISSDHYLDNINNVELKQIGEFPVEEADDEIYSDYQFIEDEEDPEAPATSLSQELLDVAQTSDGTVFYECSECGLKTKSPYTYQAHQRIHNGERPFQCSQCPRRFRISQGLNRHVREVHERQRTYSCEICGDRFGNKRNLDQHRNRHGDARPYRCEICGGSYKQKAALLIHRRIHREERQFVCGICSRGFWTRTKLQLHESTHSDERPYGCEQCESRFRNANDLRRHRKTHSTEKLQCGLCEAVFKQKRYLLKHVKTQHSQENC